MTPDLVVATDVGEAAAERIELLRPLTVVLAGGSTPRALYERLAQSDLPWSSMDVFFGDERCVPPDHPDSNYRMAREALLSKVPARVHRMKGETCDAAAYERALRRIFGAGPPTFDLVILGLGSDGHTASLFQGDPALGERERWVVRVARPDHSRITLTLPVLSAAREVLFLVAGAGKREALQRLLAREAVPAALVEAEHVTVIADPEAAASTLRGGAA